LPLALLFSCNKNSEKNKNIYSYSENNNMILDKIKKTVVKPLKFAFNLKVFLLVAPFVILMIIMNLFRGTGTAVSTVVFFVQLLLGVFIVFIITKMYLDFTGVERKRIGLSQLKEDLKEVFTTLIGAIAYIYLIIIVGFSGVLIAFIFAGLINSYSAAASAVMVIATFALFALAAIFFSLSVFYLMPSIIIGRNKLMNAIKESINLMKNNLMYSISRVLLLIAIGIIGAFAFFILPAIYLTYKAFALMDIDIFLAMSKAAQEQYIHNVFITFASENIIIALVVLALIFCGSLVLRLFSTGFVCNMYMELTSKGKKKALKKKKK